MSKVDTTQARTSFFPNRKENSVKNPKKLVRPTVKRNSAARIKELEEFAKNDAKVNIPDAIKDFSKIKKAVDMAPDIDNSSKISELKKQIQNGSYQMDYEAIADRILEQEY